MQCQTCAFFHADKRQCRRNAPTPKSEGTSALAQWPSVAVDDWCGEYRGNKDAAARAA